MSGLFPGKLAATVFKNKTELFEKAADFFWSAKGAKMLLGVLEVGGGGDMNPPAGPGQSPGGS